MKKTAKQRLMEFIAYKGISQGKFERLCEMSNGYLNNLKKTLGAEKLQNVIRAFPELNTEWLLYGKGDMIKSPSVINGGDITITGEGETLKSENNIKEEKEYSPCEDVTFVPLVPVASKGGSIDDYTSSVKLSDCEMILSPTPNAEIAITIRGDSMYPKYPNGTIVFIKEIDADLFIEWGRVYVLNTVNGSVTKVLTPSKKKGYIRCESLNPDKKFAPFDVPMKSIKGIYKILLSLNPE